MLILNDIHFAVVRSAGVTPASQEALRNYLFASVRELLDDTDQTTLLVLGDLFNDFVVAARDWVEAYNLFNSWVEKGNKLILIAGNHDVSSRGDKVSSFTMLAHVLVEQHGDHLQVLDIGQAGFVEPGVYAIAHHANQDLFNAALEAALSLEAEYHTLLLHCNANNTFAQQSDHSLDLSFDVADKFAARGVNILLAHEHDNRKVKNITVLGCQFPTSVSDCLANDKKFAHVLNDGVIQRITTWVSSEATAGFKVVDWKELADQPTEATGFIRVEGEATSTQAGEVISAIAKFRSKSAAYVITNAVAIDGIVKSESLPESFEAAKAFDVMQFIEKNTTAEEFAVIERLRG